jgi:hypothetical protein
MSVGEEQNNPPDDEAFVANSVNVQVHVDGDVPINAQAHVSEGAKVDSEAASPDNDKHAQVSHNPSGELSGAALDFVASGRLQDCATERNVNVPLKVVFQSLISSLFPTNPIDPFHNVDSVSINLDTMVPAYFADSNHLWHLAKILMDQETSPIAEPVVLKQFSDVEEIDRLPESKAPRKRRGRKNKSPLDVKGLRRGKRLNKGAGFMTAEHAPATHASDSDANMENSEPDNALKPVPLDVVPPELHVSPYQGLPASSSTVPAPYLPASLLNSIGTGFLKMSAADLPASQKPSVPDDH